MSVIKKVLVCLDPLVSVYARDRVFCATSEDGVHWLRHVPPVVDVGFRKSHDMAYYPHVWKEAGLFRMLYFGSSTIRGGIRDESVGLFRASSTDGFEWNEGKEIIFEDKAYRSSPRRGVFSGKSYLFWLEGYSAGMRLRCGLWDAERSLMSRDACFDVSFLSESSLPHGGNSFWLGDDGNFVISQKDGQAFLFGKCNSPWEWEVSAQWFPHLFGAKRYSDPSLIRMPSGEVFLYFRTTFRSAWGSKIWLAKSWDYKHWEVIGPVLDYFPRFSGFCVKPKEQTLWTWLKSFRHQLGGVAFPSVMKDEDSGKLFCFYGGFWGVHLLAWHTYWVWRT